MIFRPIGAMSSAQIVAEIQRLDHEEWAGRVADLRNELRIRRTATARGVAQAISLAVDERQEGLLSDADEDLKMMVPVPRGDSQVWINEVSAGLKTSTNGLTSIFQIKTSDGKVWDVRITPGKN